MRRLAAITLLPLALAAFAPQQEDLGGGSATTFKRRMEATFEDQIRAQLLWNKCWADHSDMPEAPRLRATFRFTIGPDGHFTTPPALIEPSEDLSNDKPMKTFVAQARRALEVCDARGWEMSADYFNLRPDRTVITLTFTARFP